MDYENFKESFNEALKESLSEKGTEVNLNVQAVEKLNGEGYDAVTVTPVDSNIGVTLNIEPYYKSFVEGVSMETIIENASNNVENGLKNQPTVDVDSLTNYDIMKDKLIMEVVSTEANELMLKDVPHHEMEDMSIVYRFVIDSSDEGRATILATNAMLDLMGVTPEQLHEDAIKNAPELKPAVITEMSEVIADMMGVSVDELSQMG